MSLTSTCICCGEKYEYCPTCGQQDTPHWKRIYDTEECMEISHILQSSRGVGGISKDEAKKQMQRYPDALEKIFEYDSLTANAIKEIFGIKDGEKRVKTVTTYIPSKEEAGKIEKVEPVVEANIETVDVSEEQQNDVETAVETEETEKVELGDSEESKVAENNNENKKSEHKSSGNKRKRYYKK